MATKAKFVKITKERMQELKKDKNLKRGRFNAGLRKKYKKKPGSVIV